jgi:hypothetical protein
MLRAACHCTAVRFVVDPPPTWVNECNCTICRRYGAPWAYTFGGEAKMLQGAGETEAYVWGDKAFGFYRCRTCGVVTHIAELDQPDQPRGINARILIDFDPANVTIRRTDNAHTGRFWSREDQPITPGRHPPMPPPGPGDWR